MKNSASIMGESRRGLQLREISTRNLPGKLAIMAGMLVLGLLLPASSSHAQATLNPTLVVSAGAGIPVGDFAGLHTATTGWAATGFAVGVEYSHPVTDLFEIGALLNANFNGLNQDELEQEFGTTSVTGTHYTVFSLMAKAGLVVEVTGWPVRLHETAYVGALHSAFPTIEGMWAGGIPFTRSASGGFGFAYGFGSGVSISSVDLTARYLGGRPEYEPEGTNTPVRKETRPISLIQVTFGWVIAL